jgi:hypothetical protein
MTLLLSEAGAYQFFSVTHKIRKRHPSLAEDIARIR